MNEATNRTQADIRIGRFRGAKVTPTQLACMAMYFFDGLSQADIAESTGVTQQAVSRHLAAGRRRLEKLGLQPRRIERDNEVCIINADSVGLEALCGQGVRARW